MERELRRYSEDIGEGSPFDLLALSHLDHDHVCGVDDLLAQHQVETVLLPYLHPWERLILVAEACERGNLSPDRFDLIASPATWFADRGARRVVFVLPSSPSDNSPVPVLLRPDPLPPDERKDRAGHEGDGGLQLGGYEQATEADVDEFIGLAKETFVIRPGGTLTISLAEAVVWLLTPYVHPEPERLRAFLQDVARILQKPSLARQPPSPEFFKRVKEAVADRRKRVLLAGAYRLIRQDRNLSSMSLFSGPSVRGVMRHRFCSQWGTSRRNDRAMGWISTGDSVLVRRIRAKAFERFFADLLPEVGTFVVPHHGSKHNFAGELFSNVLENVDWVIASGRNQYGHPDETLEAALSERGEVVNVGENPRSTYRELLILDQMRPQARPLSAGRVLDL